MNIRQSMILKPVLFAFLILGLLGAAQETYAAITPPPVSLPPDLGPLAYEFANTLFIQDEASCLKLQTPSAATNAFWKPKPSDASVYFDVCELHGYHSFYPNDIADRVIIEKGILLKLMEGQNGAGIGNDLILINFGKILNYGTIRNYNVIENYGLINIVSDTDSRLINKDGGTVLNLGPDAEIRNQELISNYGKFVNDGIVSNLDSNDNIINQDGEWINTKDGIIGGGTFDNRSQLDNYGKMILLNFDQYAHTNNVGEISTVNLKNKMGVINNYGEMETTSYLLNKSIIRNCGDASFKGTPSSDSDGVITWNINCPPKPTMPDIEEFTLPFEYSESGERIEQEIETRMSDELRERIEQELETRMSDEFRGITEQGLIDDNDKRVLKLLQIQEENNELRSKVSVLEEKIQGLNAVIMEQIRVMLETLGLR